MPAPKGGVMNPKGRGNVPNKATRHAREAIARFVDMNAHRLESWLDRIAEDSPKDAFNCYLSIVEYHIPKLARTESETKHTGKIEFSWKE
jgi:hypothetical protein